MKYKHPWVFAPSLPRYMEDKRILMALAVLMDVDIPVESLSKCCMLVVCLARCCIPDLLGELGGWVSAACSWYA